MKLSKISLIVGVALLANQTLVLGNDSVNVVDATGKKQGLWKITNAILHKECYEENQIVEEGSFKDSRKNGFWMEYYCNNKIKSKINYVNNRPNGHAVIYHENGKVKEEGTWQNNRWVGSYKLFYATGQIQQSFNFSATGKREGKQVYYYENGQVMMEGSWTEGKEFGEIKEYYENGDIKSVRDFSAGKVDREDIRTYDSKKPVVATQREDDVKAPSVVVEKTEKGIASKPFDGEGYWQLYNSNRQITKDGEFKKNKLIDGRAYFYDDHGILTRIAIYRDGKYVGDGVIEE